MLLYHIVRYRLDLLLLAAFAVYGAWHCTVVIRSRRPGARRLSTAATWLAGLTVVVAGLLAEFAGRRQREFLVSVFAGFGPTYARELEQAGHARVTFATPPTDPTYLALIEWEKDWLKLNPLIADIYTVRRDPEGRIRFVVDSETDYNHDGRYEGEREQRTGIGEVYPQTTPPFLTALAGHTVFDPEIVADRWGTWVSSLSPIYDGAGRVDGVVGIDYPAGDWLRAIELRRGFVLLSGAVLLGLLLSSVTLITLMRSEIDEKAAAQRELQRAKEAADAASRAKGEFLAVMSHEIRTPLTAITGYASMLEGTALDALQQRYVRTMLRGAHSLVDLLNNILDYSKIEDGKLQLEALPCRPAEIVGEVVELLRATLHDKQLALRFDDRTDGRLTVEGDHTRLRQVVMNLVGNAVKFTAKGTVVVTMTWARAEHEAGRGTLSIAVADTGPGIAAEKLPKLFQMFAQAEPGTARRHGGSGLGLAISRRLVEMMDGHISVRSTEGIGSTFTIVLPCRAVAPSAAASDPVELPRAGTTSARLLVVDDTPVNREVMKALLEPTGYEIDVAESGPAAVAMAAARTYGAILMDIAMPGMDGVTAARHIRAAETTRRVPIIAVTAATSKADREACTAAGMDDFIPKPIDRALLLRSLARLCGQPATAPS